MVEIWMEKKFVNACGPYQIIKSIFNLRVILKCAIFVHYVMDQSLVINCMFSCCSEEPVK